MNIPLHYLFIVLFRAIDCTTPVVAGDTLVTDAVAERMLVYQRDNGGWPQPGGDPINYQLELSKEVKNQIRKDRKKKDTTIDDDATTREIRYLAGAFSTTRNQRYRKAANEGIDYLLRAQYFSGGWGQFFPDTTGYRKHITFNDNAMVNVLELLLQVARQEGDFSDVEKEQALAAQKAIDRAVDCILKCQYVQNGTRTVWCAQHDRDTFLPAKARAFELPSLSGSESVGITRFLMHIDHPAPEVKTAIQAAVTWFEKVKIMDTDTRLVYNEAGKVVDRIVFSAPGKVVWARFYDLHTNQPFFTGRNGQPRKELKEIEAERRTGYSFYGTYAEKLLTKDYPKWKQKWDI